MGLYQTKCCLSMNGYVQDILDCYHHIPPKKPQLYPHKHTDIFYQSLVQYATEADSRPLLESLVIKRVQGIISTLLYYEQPINNNMLVTFRSIGSQKASSTERTTSSTTQLLDYIVTYPNYGITYRTRSMVLTGHYNTSFLNETKARSRAEAHIFIPKDVPIPSNNYPLLTLSQIIKFAMSSAAKSELAALFVSANHMPPLLQTLIKMVWPQPR